MDTQSIYSDLARHQYSRPIKPENRVVLATKNIDGSMTCKQSSGNEFTIPAVEIKMQAWVAFTMIYANEL